MNKEKRVFDYSKLEGRIKELYGTQTNLAKYLSYGSTSLSMKLKNKVLFSQPDILELIEVLNIPDNQVSDYFFKVEVRLTEQKREEVK